MEIPADWDAMLRAYSPITTTAPWLALRWFPMERQIKDGSWRECGRWVLYECVPEALVRSWDRTSGNNVGEIFDLLAGPQPSRIADRAERQAKAMLANDYQCRMYREHRVWARNLWVIQGSQGGHPVEYLPHEQKMLQAAGLPTDPPPVGTLPYAPFDQRVIDQLRRRSRLERLGSMSAVQRQARSDVVEREMQEAERDFRRWHYDMVRESMAASADFLAYYGSSAKTATEARRTIPETSRDELNAVARAKETYIDTGVIPGQGIGTRALPLSTHP